MRKSYHEFNRTDVNHLYLDQNENAIESLENVVLSLSRKDNMKWKWVIGSLIHSLYSFCIANLTGSNYENVLTSVNNLNEDENKFSKRGDGPWKKSFIKKRGQMGGYTIHWKIVNESELPTEKPYRGIEQKIKSHNDKKIISFWSALARVQDSEGQMIMYMDSVPLLLNDDEWKSIEFLYYYAHEFLKFVPTSLFMDVDEIKKHCLKIIPPIKFLVKSFNILYADKSMPEWAENYLIQIESELNCRNEVSGSENISFNPERIKKYNELKVYEELIKKGENEVVELKSSLRYPTEKDQEKKILENEVLKSICAMANKRGGKVFIGVDNKGVILGLENDYNTFNEGRNYDKFELHLTQIIENRIKPSVLHYLSKDVIVINGKEICVINIQESLKPIFLEYKGEKQFIVREGTMSPKYTKEKMEEHIRVKKYNNSDYLVE